MGWIACEGISNMSGEKEHCGGNSQSRWTGCCRGLMCIPPLRGSPLRVSWRRGVETSFTPEASKLLSAFREIAGNFSPDVVDTVYQVILAPKNAPLSHEIFPAAVSAEQGADVRTISEMAASGAFEGGRMDIQQM